ncbi:MAG: hypothetical protein LBS28_05560 [Streptococcaceae bacterium]|nr:hypothetical protein [Streptococcaceae bacterium]
MGIEFISFNDFSFYDQVLEPFH